MFPIRQLVAAHEIIYCVVFLTCYFLENTAHCVEPKYNTLRCVVLNFIILLLRCGLLHCVHCHIMLRPDYASFADIRRYVTHTR